MEVLPFALHLPLSVIQAPYLYKNGTVQWSAWMTHTHLHPPTIEVHLFPIRIRSCLTRLTFLISQKELQADVARQQRMLEKVALIEARDRAEEQEKLRIRQENQNNISQRVLADLNSSAEKERSGRQNDFADDSKTRSSDELGEQEISSEDEVKEVASTRQVSNGDILAQANGPKIRPPTFLTPAKSTKSQTTPIFSPAFASPPGVFKNTGQSAFGREHQCQQKVDTEPFDTTQSAGPDSAKQKVSNGVNPLPVMPSRVTETESWVPNARARKG